METVSSILQRRTASAAPAKRHMSHEWQAFAYKVWMKLHGTRRDLPNIIRHFRLYHETHRPLLDSAFSFCSDYTGSVPPIKLFYWKFWQMYKSSRPKGHRV